MLKWIKIRSVKQKIICSFVVISVILIVLQVGVFQFWINSIILRQAEANFQETVRQVGKRAELQYEQMDENVRSILYNQIIKNYLTDLKRNNISYHVAKYQIARRIMKLPNLEMVDNIYIFPVGYMPMNLFYKEALFQTDERTKAMMKAAETRSVSEMIWTVHPETHQLSILMHMYNGNELLGLLRVDLNEKFHDQLEDAKLGETGGIYLSSHGTILFAQDPEWINRDESQLEKLSGVKVTYTLGYHGWKLTGVVPEAELLNQVKQINSIMLLMELLVLAFIFMFALVILRLILKPLNRIMKGMESIRQGKLDAIVENAGSDEFSVIIRHFNDMVERVNHLIKTIYHQQQNYRKAEMVNLQSKLNPHFLYNTLDMIYWMSVMKDEEEISDAILSLSKILRYSISHTNEFVPVSEDMEQLENYLRIQRMRFEDKLQYLFFIDRDIADIKIPKLLIQPLVENSIKYAFREMSFGGTIIVRGFAKGDDLFFEVEDNGAGMPEEQVQSLMSPSHPEKKEGGLGIQMVKQRIKYVYGEDCGISIDSAPGLGTKITLKLRKTAEFHQDSWIPQVLQA